LVLLRVDLTYSFSGNTIAAKMSDRLKLYCGVIKNWCDRPPEQMGHCGQANNGDPCEHAQEYNQKTAELLIEADVLQGGEVFCTVSTLKKLTIGVFSCPDGVVNRRLIIERSIESGRVTEDNYNNKDYLK